MTKRDFADMVIYCCQKVSEMNISRKCRMELLGMITAIEMKHDELMLKWIPVSERLPEKEKRHYWVCTDTGYQCQCRWTNDVYGFGASDRWNWKIFDIPQYQKVVAWMSLPEAYRGEE